MLFAAALLLFPLVLHSAEPERLSQIVEKMRQLTNEGDQPAVGRLLPELLKELAKPSSKSSFGWNQAGVYFTMQGDYAQAERAYRRGIQVSETENDSASRALLLLNLAAVHLQSKRPALAERRAHQALKLATELYHPGASELASYIYILGSARQQQGDQPGAREYFQQALDIAGNSPDGKARQGVVLANLAVSAGLEKRWLEAKEFLLRAIAVTEPVIGPSHPDLIRTHLNLALVYEHLKEWDPAYASAAKARQITVARLGPSHEIMAEILTASASILRKSGRGDEARDLSRQAKAIAKARPRDAAASAWIDVADLARVTRR